WRLETYCRYHRRTFVRVKPPRRPDRKLCELLQESHIAQVELRNLIHAILQDRNPLHAHAKREPAHLRRIVTVVLHELEYVRVHHPAAQQFNPAAELAGPATLPATEDAAHLHIGARLGEWEKRRIKSRFHRR